jgi:HEPN domain-containing protein
MKRETEEWLKIAEEDFQAAEHLFEISLSRMVCYHAQQSVEKGLKTILTEKGIDFSRTHNILDL